MFKKFNRPTEFARREAIRGGQCLLAAGMLVLLAGSFSFAIDPAVTEKDSRSNPEITWDTTLRKFQFDADKFIGQRLTVHCPPAPVDLIEDGIFGTDFYPSDSPICLAALHAGKITKDGGTITIQLNAGQSKYSGSQRNGVKSADLPRTGRSIMFVDQSNAAEADRIRLAHIPRVSWDTKFTSTGFAYRHLVGQRLTFQCPAAPSNLKPRLIYGTDHYDFASRVCHAALHAGAITKEGGVVTVQIDPAVSRLVGSIRNGVETKGKGSGDRTISFVNDLRDKGREVDHL